MARKFIPNDLQIKILYTNVDTTKFQLLKLLLFIICLQYDVK